MLSIDVLWYSLSLGFLVLVGFFSFALYQLGKVFTSVGKITRDVEDIVHDIEITKERLKLGVIDSVLAILKKVRR